MKKLYLCILAVACVMTACNSSVTKGTEISVTGSDGTVYNSYQSACRDGDFDAAWAFVDKLEAQSMEFDKYDRYIQQNVSAYTSARDFVFNSEVQMLFSNGSTEASDRIVYLLNSLPIKGKRLEEGYEGTDACTSIVDASSFNKDFAWYCESVNSYNNKCRQILELCISQNNKYLADKIVKLVKETPTSNEGSAFDYVVHYTNTDINEVKKMYDEAIKSGAFK